MARTGQRSMLPVMIRHLLLTGMLAACGAIAYGAEQIVTLKDGRKLTGVYDEAAGTVTTSGAVKAVIKVARADVVKVETTSAPAAPTAPSDDHGRKQDPLAAIDLLLTRKQQDKQEAETNAAEAKKRAELERASAAKAENPERQKSYTERAQRLGEAATRYTTEANRLTLEINDLKRKRQETEKEVVKDAALAATLKAADELTGKIIGDADSPLARYRKLDGESRDLQLQIKNAQDQLNKNQSEMARLSPQLDLAMVAGMDLKEHAFVERPNESDADKAKRIGEHKLYNDAMTALRQAKTELDDGKSPSVQTPLTTLRQDAMRRLHQEKTGRPLVFWDETLKALDARK